MRRSDQSPRGLSNIADLLDLAKIESTGGRAQASAVEPPDAADVIKGVMASLRLLARRHGWAIRRQA